MKAHEIWALSRLFVAFPIANPLGSFSSILGHSTLSRESIASMTNAVPSTLTSHWACIF